MKAHHVRAGLLLILVLMSACAGQPTTVAEAPAMPASGGELGWWYIRFRLNWLKGEEPLWYPDLLLADRVVGPVLDARRAEIPLWRFHRRAACDGAGWTGG